MADGSCATQNKRDIALLNACNERKTVQKTRLSNMARLGRVCDELKQVVTSSKKYVQDIQEEFEGVDLITEEQWIATRRNNATKVGRTTQVNDAEQRDKGYKTMQQ